MDEENHGSAAYGSDTSLMEASQEVKNHWPTWAIVLVIVCIVLTALAFLLGNFITKKATPIRFKGQSTQVGKGRERKWGAGFSGGMWGAAT
ncbi:unnamed protein product [Caenorhabditis auriculariae]|uniref:Uncharacterized protein n=1 Tax=Caenorhabditis auriculariae TaxID=2777116 RepID=A0A8S1GX71_9PELO|nr:unnamed protein product [Caenorhabditis auriculariae]